jgi:probable phosphoglycerate mutase
MDWGGWEGKRGLDLIADPRSGYRHIEEWGWDFAAPGGETPRAVLVRIQPWLERLSGTTIVVTHIGVMRVILARAYAWDFRGEPPFQVKRDRLYVVDVQDDGSMIAQQKPVRLIPAQAGGWSA